MSEFRVVSVGSGTCVYEVCSDAVKEGVYIKSAGNVSLDECPDQLCDIEKYFRPQPTRAQKPSQQVEEYRRYGVQQVTPVCFHPSVSDPGKSLTDGSSVGQTDDETE